MNQETRDRAQHATCSLVHGLGMPHKAIRTTLREWYPGIGDKQMAACILHAENLGEAKRAELRERFAGKPPSAKAMTLMKLHPLPYGEALTLLSLCKDSAPTELAPTTPFVLTREPTGGSTLWRDLHEQSLPLVRRGLSESDSHRLVLSRWAKATAGAR